MITSGQKINSLLNSSGLYPVVPKTINGNESKHVVDVTRIETAAHSLSAFCHNYCAAAFLNFLSCKDHGDPLWLNSRCQKLGVFLGSHF